MSVPSLFPYADVRPGQDHFMQRVTVAVTNRAHLIIHAPTGLGKTAAVLAPALEYALAQNKTIFFLTARHTQHAIVLETIRSIANKRSLNIPAISIIGKQWLCAQPGAVGLMSRDFHTYCSAMRDGKHCSYYENLRVDNGVNARITSENLARRSPTSAEETLATATAAGLCPYEIGINVAERATVIITDYYYLFDSRIRSQFFRKINRKLEDSIVIIDEGHNTPARCRDLLTHTLSSLTIARALKEARQFGMDDARMACEELQQNTTCMNQHARTDEIQIKQSDIVLSPDVASAANLFEERGKEVLETQQQSALSQVAEFLHAWGGENTGFVRYLKKGLGRTNLYYQCLDPSKVSRDLICKSHSTILMSGTLTPTKMYRDTLGFPANTEEHIYPSPFDKARQCTLVVPKTTTRFAQRGSDQYAAISAVLADICSVVPGRLAVFFPSYAIRDAVLEYFTPQCTKTILCEQASLQKHEREAFLAKFKTYGEAVLLGVAAGSFGEGVDMPGILKGVIVVGLPLERPSLETNALIHYYDNLFAKGWDYGYVLPALTKCLQNAGRCIRSEADAGVIVFLDERFAWPQYLACIPADWKATVTTNYAPLIRDFFRDLKLSYP